MKYTRAYEADRAVNEAKALIDCKQYLGTSYKKVMKTLTLQISGMCAAGARTGKCYRFIRLSLMFCGIEGYWPVRAMARQVFHNVKEL